MLLKQAPELADTSRTAQRVAARVRSIMNDLVFDTCVVVAGTANSG
jgi:hypothetical protein